MPKATMTQADKAWMAEDVARQMDNGNALILVSVVKTSSTNLSYSYRVRMVSPALGGLLRTTYLNYWLASELGESLNKDDDLKGNGCGFDRGFDAVYTIGKILERHGLTDNGHRWASGANWGWF
jgi:hypothetical protein